MQRLMRVQFPLTPTKRHPFFVHNNKDFIYHNICEDVSVLEVPRVLLIHVRCGAAQIGRMCPEVFVAVSDNITITRVDVERKMPVGA